MFYTFARNFVAVLLFILNGNAHYLNRDKIPNDENYIMVAPHRTLWDPVYMAIGSRPKKFIFMAKEELFRNPLLGFILRKVGAFPVNRDKPGPSAIKTPTKLLKSGDRSLIMFPSGTRHSTDLKGGVAVIAKMAKVRIVPSVYQGPLKLSHLLFLRKRVDVNFGEPIDISDIKKLNAEGLAEVERRLNAAFDKLDKEINPDFVYIPTPKKEKKK
ncbi:MAG: 1-acyl-sn-glycerol-3-phosphate acyltransferase [Lactobacillales bacterium]|jgi:1-acyl-sn-glycerol-3-phosphate acyltransferase|nr:1-acyl-sn-glycerol-3-phosphate acyltransferase [Lactobacillales bacterium]